MAIGRVCEAYLDEIEMEEGRRRYGQRQTSNSDERKVTVVDQPSNAEGQNDGPSDDQHCICLAQVIPVDDRSPIATFRFEKHGLG